MEVEAGAGVTGGECQEDFSWKKKPLWTAQKYIKLHQRLQKVFALSVLDTQLVMHAVN